MGASSPYLPIPTIGCNYWNTSLLNILYDAEAAAGDSDSGCLQLLQHPTPQHLTPQHSRPPLTGWRWPQSPATPPCLDNAPRVTRYMLGTRLAAPRPAISSPEASRLQQLCLPRKSLNPRDNTQNIRASPSQARALALKLAASNSSFSSNPAVLHYSLHAFDLPYKQVYTQVCLTSTGGPQGEERTL